MGGGGGVGGDAVDNQIQEGGVSSGGSRPLR